MDFTVMTNTRGWLDFGAFGQALSEIIAHQGVASNGDRVTVTVSDDTAAEAIEAAKSWILNYSPPVTPTPTTVEEAIASGNLLRAIELLHQTIDDQAALIASLQQVGG